MLTADDLARIAEVVRQELARALHPSVRLEITADPARFDAYVSRPANDPEQPDEPPPPNHAA